MKTSTVHAALWFAAFQGLRRPAEEEVAQQEPSAAPSPATSDLPYPSGTVFAGRFMVETHLGVGGFAHVYRAYDCDTRSRVALKILMRNLEEREYHVMALRQEAEFGARVVHGNVRAITGFGTTPEGDEYLVMEYVEGETLDALMTREGPLPCSRAISIACQTCEALEACHGQGIIHRDVKPENVLLTRDGADAETVKLADFGAAWSRFRNRTYLDAVGRVVGTPEYMAPEQFEARRVNRRTDVFGLAAVLFHMIAGQVPYPGETPQEIYQRVVREDRRLLSDLRSSLPFGLDAILVFALARNPKERPATALRFARQLAKVRCSL